MADVSNLSDMELKLLQEVAKAKGLTLEQVLIEQGYKAPAQEPEPAGPVTKEHPHVFSEFTEPEEAVPPPPMVEEEAASDLDNKKTTLTSICPQCGWDQELPVLVDPTRADKQVFLQSILGQKVFVKKYLVLGGNLEIDFRGLTLAEIDACYTAASAALKAQQLATNTDYYEYINRLRMGLQFTGLASNNKTLFHRLPDGLNRVSNPSATLFWDDFLREKGLTNTDTSLVDQVCEYVTNNVLPTEHLQRIVTTKCAEFNRLVGRLEVAINDENFWKEIGLQL